ncbi:MAG: DUF1553 domain-containing protein [Fuerstiella sp.]
MIINKHTSVGRFVRWAAMVLLLLGGTEPEAQDDRFSAVRSLFESRCLSCHNNHDRQGDFSLETSEALTDSGYVVPGRADESHLLSVLVPDGNERPAMPRDADPLKPDQVQQVRDWVAAGAPWPDDVRLVEPVVQDFDWWSFRPLVRPAIPDLPDVDESLLSSPIDAFILEKQIEKGLTPVEPADRRTLIRRLSFDLTGLPPTPEQIRAFEADDRPGAWDRLVEQLLASERYGERWARHWLDVVRYADTCGYDKDKLRPNAWPYRDYVIRSFNQDKPYSRFVQEQIAGDALFPGNPDGILGLGFIAAGPWDFIGHVEVPESKIDGMVARNLDRDEMASNVMNAFCSVTIQCARCHNHKFDPFTQEHYYGLQAVFAAVDRADRPFDTDPEVEQRRSQMKAALQQVKADLKAFDTDVQTRGGDKLKTLTQRIAELTPQAGPADKPPEFGYHSQLVADADSVKWVEIDLGRHVEVAQVILHPCHDEFAGIGAGFGFPVRFRVEAWAEAAASRPSADTESGVPAEQERGPSLILADFTGGDVANPGLAAVDIPADGAHVRYLRVSATRLAERKNDYMLALAEVEVRDKRGDNVALSAAVTAIDSIEAPVRWRKTNLTDGLWPQAADPAAAAELADAERRRGKILSEILTPDRVAVQQKLLQEQDRLTRELDGLPVGQMVYAAATEFSPQGNFKPTGGTPRTVHVLHRGNVQQPKQVAVPAAIPLSSSDNWRFDLSADHTEAERRVALARWITRDDNPLTWRSIANRIWQYHFGRGLVSTPNDLGRMGQLPTHPELLDWLADEFRRTQSFRHMHRLIVNSATWRRSSAHDAQNASIDGDNQYLWRMNRRRLSAEEFRDAVLMVSGSLNLEMGGPGFYLFELEKTEHSPHFEYHKFDPNDPASHRRSVYRFIVRSQPDPFMTTLDCADSSQSTPRRTETLTSLQALSLLNNRFNLAMAERFADRVAAAAAGAAEAAEAGDAKPEAYAFALVTGRPPTDAELTPLVDYSAKHGLPSLCRVLFNLSEFVFVD